MRGLTVDGAPVSVHETAPGELICWADGDRVTIHVFVPTRAPALLCEIRLEEVADCALEWTGPDDTPGRLSIPASEFEDKCAYVALSRLGAVLWSADVPDPDWPRALGSPAMVPDRVRKERTTARDNRLRVVLEGDAIATDLSSRVVSALANVDAWVTKGDNGEPMAVASYGPEGAQPATPSELAILARALLAAGQYADVDRWSSFGLLDERTQRARTLWMGGEDAGVDETLWQLPEIEADTPAHVAEAGTLLHALHGTLGLRPDATYGRAGMAPHCGSVHGFRVEDLRIGTSQFSLTYRCEAGRHRFEARQTWGVVPVMLVLEPWLPVDPEAPVRVDGQPGSPTREPEGEGTRVRLQMPLEAERSLEMGPSSPDERVP